MGKQYMNAPNFVQRALPAGYTQVEYIQSSGTQYINTGFNPNQDTRVTIVCEPLATGEWKGAFGARNASNVAEFAVDFPAATQVRSMYGTEGVILTVSSMAARFEIDKNKNICTINGTVLTNTAQTFQTTCPICLFMKNTAGSSWGLLSMKVYSCKIYDDETLVRDFVPATNSGGTVGMYDLVNGVFYTNAGTGTFTAGPTQQYVNQEAKKWYLGAAAFEERELPAGYTQVEYIRGEGVQYIDTGIKATAYTTAKYKYSADEILTYGPHVLTGEAWYFPMVRGITSAGTFVVNRGGNEIGTAAIAPATDFPYEVDAHFTGNKVTVNGVEYGDFPMGSTAVDTKNLHLMTPGSYPGDSRFTMSGKLYYCKIYEAGVLVRDYVPAVNDAGVAGLYDVVNGTFEQSIGSGAFLAGPTARNVARTIKRAYIGDANGIARMFLGGLDVATMVIGYTGAYTDQKEVVMSGKTYRLLTLTGSGTLTLPEEVTADVWMCSGGTSGNDGSTGNYNYAGGGGAGGFAKQFSTVLSAGSHLAVVGSGGGAAAVNAQTGFNAGAHSSFSGQQTAGTFSVNSTYKYYGTSGGTGGGGGGGAAGSGDGVQKIPFGDSSVFANAHCAGGGGGGTRNGSTYRKGGAGGTNGGNGNAGTTGDYSGGSGGVYGGGAGGQGYSGTRDGSAATYYGSGGGGGGSYGGGAYGTGGAGYQGVIYVRIPYEQ